MIPTVAVDVVRTATSSPYSVSACSLYFLHVSQFSVMRDLNSTTASSNERRCHSQDERNRRLYVVDDGIVPVVINISYFALCVTDVTCYPPRSHVGSTQHKETRKPVHCTAFVAAGSSGRLPVYLGCNAVSPFEWQCEVLRLKPVREDQYVTWILMPRCSVYRPLAHTSDAVLDKF
jgi:hypothetical protein